MAETDRDELKSGSKTQAETAAIKPKPGSDSEKGKVDPGAVTHPFSQSTALSPPAVITR